MKKVSKLLMIAMLALSSAKLSHIFVGYGQLQPNLLVIN